MATKDQHQVPAASAEPVTLQAPVVHVHNTNYASAVAEASAAAVEPPDPGPRKYRWVAYAALVVGAMIGLHRWYLKKMPILWTVFLYIGFFAATGPTGTLSELGGVAFIFGMFAIDACLIPGWVRRHNVRRDRLMAAASAPTLTVPAMAGAVDAHRGEREKEQPERRDRPPPDLRTRLLRVAHRGDGQLTLTQAVMETEEDFEAVEAALHALVAGGHVDVDNHPDSGIVVYRFPELVGRPVLRARSDG